MAQPLDAATLVPLPIPGMGPEDELRRRNIAAAARWRWIFIGMAVLIPLALGMLFQRQTNRLRALVDHGQPATASVTHITRQGGVVYTAYRYEVRGETYEWSVSQRDAPYPPGESFAITYLPEDPSLSRPGATYSQARFDAEVDLSFQRRLLIGIFAFFTLAAAYCERTRRRLRQGSGSVGGVTISPMAAGRALAVLFLLVALGVNLDPKVTAVQAAAFGPAPLGLPIAWVVPLVEVALYLPYFWVFPHLMHIVMAAQAGGASLSRAGIVLSVVRAGPELRRSRIIVIAGFVYFVALMAAWIAFAESRGV